MFSRTLLLIATLAVLQAAAPGQSRDSAATSRTGEQRRQTGTTDPAGFRDGNGNGVDDRTEHRAQGTAVHKDRFVDADGDGICDGRAAGFGFKRGPMNGQGGPGAGKGNGTGHRYGQGGKK